MVVFGRNVSKVRGNYWLRFFFRIAVLIAGVLLYIFYPQSFDVLDGWNFFKEFSPFHVLWAIWMYDMILQIFPIKSNNALGSKKVFGFSYKEAKKVSPEAVKLFRKKNNKRALFVGALWIVFTAALCFVYKCEWGFLSFFDEDKMFIGTLMFYIFDLICVLIWCPFRLMLGNKCCTTCRIFNWDHIMMFSPVLLVGGFYTISLVVMALICLAVWEINIIIHPERFWEGSNDSLKCANCTDKLCTHLCEKGRKAAPEKEKEPATM